MKALTVFDLRGRETHRHWTLFTGLSFFKSPCNSQSLALTRARSWSSNQEFSVGSKHPSASASQLDGVLTQLEARVGNWNDRQFDREYHHSNQCHGNRCLHSKATHGRDPEGVGGTWLHPVEIWEWTKGWKSCLFSYLCSSAFQVKK